MKRISNVLLKLVSVMALAVTVLNVNSSCPLFMYEPEEPQQAKRYKL